MNFPFYINVNNNNIVDNIVNYNDILIINKNVKWRKLIGGPGNYEGGINTAGE